MPAGIRVEDLDAETLRRLTASGAIPRPKRTTFTKEHVRRHAIRVLNTIEGLSQAERARVLTHARKLNEV